MGDNNRSHSSEYELRNKENIRQKEEMLKTLMDNFKLSPKTEAKKPLRKSLTKKRESKGFEIPTELLRRSKRTKKNDDGSYIEENDFVELEDFKISRRRTFRIQVHHRPSNREIKMPEDISNADLNKIAKNSGCKVYDKNGTTCHQCRQKTSDIKTICRSEKCVGVRGQFCGPCILNRYGEDPKACLLDPNWICPPCRELCNCSICRTKQGLAATGILAPVAKRKGYESVHHLLKDSGSFIDESDEED